MHSFLGIVLFYILSFTIFANATLATCSGELSPDIHASYIVSVLPAQGGWFQIVAVGPDGKVKRGDAFNSDQASYPAAIINGRKLEMALNSGALDIASVDSYVLKNLIRPLNLSITSSTARKTTAIILAQELQNEVVSLGSTSTDALKITVTGRKHFTQMAESKHSNLVSYSRAVVNARKLQNALNSEVLDRQNITRDLLDYLIGARPAESYTVQRRADRRLNQAIELVESQRPKRYSVLIGPSPNENSFTFVIVTPLDLVITATGYGLETHGLEETFVTSLKLQRALRSGRLLEAQVTSRLLYYLTRRHGPNDYVFPDIVSPLQIIEAESLR